MNIKCNKMDCSSNNKGICVYNKEFDITPNTDDCVAWKKVKTVCAESFYVDVAYDYTKYTTEYIEKELIRAIRELVCFKFADVLNVKAIPPNERNLTDCNVDFLYNRIYGTSEDDEREKNKFLKMVIDMGYTSHNAHQYARLNTLFGYDIGIDVAMKIAEAMKKENWSVEEFDGYYEKEMKEICSKYNINTIRFDKWTKEDKPDNKYSNWSEDE